MREFVVLSDGAQLPLTALRRRVPHTTFATGTHVDVCERLVDQRCTGGDLRDVYVNLVSLKSNRAKELTALITLIRAGKLNVRAVRSSFVGREFADLLGKDVQILGNGVQNGSLTSRRYFVRYALKVLANRLFRLFGRRWRARETVVRAWVDTTDSVYPDDVERAKLLIYPFAANVVRQLRYVARCRRRQRDFTLMGLPYRLRDLLRIPLRWKQRDRIFVEGEAQAYRKHATELLARGVRQVLTTDEFEAGACEMHRSLTAHGVYCHNTWHGVGVYCPNVHYSHTCFYNSQQRSFYRRGGHQLSENLRCLVPIRPTPGRDAAGRGDPVVVFVQGNWRQAGKQYEADFEDRALRAARAACERLNLPLVVKVHPNTNALTRLRLKMRHGVRVTRDFSQGPGYRPIFLNTLSTAYYASLHDGPTVFLQDDLLRPQSVFGDEVHAADLGNLPEELARFREHAYWTRRYEEQIERETRAGQSAEGVQMPVRPAWGNLQAAG